ncbi:MAG: hypothetical protein KC416_02730 [Myxococcales bacterium]|nr:hypothetical protein [Myxococcales bacterium]
MPTQKTPLSQVKDGFKDKASLVSAIRSLTKGTDLWVEREGNGLDHAPNAKLLRLHAVLSEAKKAYGTREKMVDAIAAAEGRAKDKDYRNRFENWTAARLLDYVKAAEKRAKN